MRPHQKLDPAVMLKFIRGFIDVNGYSPTLQELARRYRVSVTCIVDALKRLEESGEITRTRGHRCIQVNERKAAA